MLAMTRSSFGDAQSAQMTLQTPFRMRAFLLALTLVLLAGCANVAPLLSAILTNQVAFTPGQLQTQLDRRFPRDYQQANGLVTLRVLNPRLSIVYLPPYTPEFNPVEQVWAYVKRHLLANCCPTTVQELKALLRSAWQKVRYRRLPAKLLGITEEFLT